MEMDAIFKSTLQATQNYWNPPRDIMGLEKLGFLLKKTQSI